MMDPLRHWHPVLLESELRDRPVGVRVWDQEIVLFRDGNGGVGALRDQCLHRRMRLSEGTVKAGCVVCPYHGWRYDRRGHGTSPGNERMRVEAPTYDVATRHGVVWVKTPYQLLVDNFIEIEHTCVAHWLFGFDVEDMPRVKLRSESLPEQLHIVCEGPQKRIPKPVELLAGFRSGDHFVADWTLDFAPLRATYTFTHRAKDTGALRQPRAKEVVYFAPIHAEESLLVAFYFTNLPPTRLNRALVLPVYRRWVDYEYELDRRILENLADRRTDLDGLRLGRFDKPLLEFRRALRERVQAKPGQHLDEDVPAPRAVDA